MTTGALLAALFGCVAGNFTYHAMTDRNWEKASELSVAQATVVAVVLIVAFIGV